MVELSIEKCIGNTPLARLQNIERAYGVVANVFAKLENVNPGGSIKDRVAKSIIDDAEKRGVLKNGGTVYEATSGNTGVGLALVAAARGYRAVIVMPDTMSVERQKLMKAYGAEVVLTNGALGMQGAVEKAAELVKATPNGFLASQFDNPANVQAHYRGTAQEIWQQTQGNIDIFVAGVGTGGTLTGIGKFLKEQNPKIQVVAVEPLRSPLLSKGVAGAHAIHGIGANFIPDTLDTSLLDEIIPVEDTDAMKMARFCARTEGVLIGVSAGCALHAAVELAKRPENKGKTIVTLFPDSGERYLSTGLYD